MKLKHIINCTIFCLHPRTKPKNPSCQRNDGQESSQELQEFIIQIKEKVKAATTAAQRDILPVNAHSHASATNAKRRDILPVNAQILAQAVQK